MILSSCTCWSKTIYNHVINQTLFFSIIFKSYVCLYLLPKNSYKKWNLSILAAFTFYPCYSTTVHITSAPYHSISAPCHSTSVQATPSQSMRLHIGPWYSTSVACHFIFDLLFVLFLNLVYVFSPQFHVNPPRSHTTPLRSILFHRWLIICHILKLCNYSIATPWID